jgi:hypothetical protein
MDLLLVPYWADPELDLIQWTFCYLKSYFWKFAALMPIINFLSAFVDSNCIDELKSQVSSPSFRGVPSEVTISFVVIFGLQAIDELESQVSSPSIFYFILKKKRFKSSEKKHN